MKPRQELELIIIQDAQQMQGTCQNPCDFCADNAEEMGLEIQKAEYNYDDVCLGIRICLELCREHYLERKLMEYEENEH